MLLVCLSDGEFRELKTLLPLLLISNALHQRVDRLQSDIARDGWRPRSSGCRRSKALGEVYNFRMAVKIQNFQQITNGHCPIWLGSPEVLLPPF